MGPMPDPAHASNKVLWTHLRYSYDGDDRRSVLGLLDLSLLSLRSSLRGERERLRLSLSLGDGDLRLGDLFLGDGDLAIIAFNVS